MKTLRIFCFIALAFLMTTCEKGYLEDEKPTTEIPDKDDDEEDDDPEDKDSTSTNDPFLDEDDDVTTFHTGDKVSVSTFLNYDINCEVWVVGYIVGACTKNIKNADFVPPFEYQTSILLADDPDETDINKVITIQLKSNSHARTDLNLVDHPENYKHKAMVFGAQGVYLYAPGMKDIGSYELL